MYFFIGVGIGTVACFAAMYLKDYLDKKGIL